METIRHQEIETRVLELADSSRPGTFYKDLRGLTLGLFSEGFNREALLDSYERAAHELHGSAEELEDEVLEVMAELEGWCGPSARL